MAKITVDVLLFIIRDGDGCINARMAYKRSIAIAAADNMEADDTKISRDEKRYFCTLSGKLTGLTTRYETKPTIDIKHKISATAKFATYFHDGLSGRFL